MSEIYCDMDNYFVKSILPVIYKRKKHSSKKIKISLHNLFTGFIFSTLLTLFTNLYHESKSLVVMEKLIQFNFLFYTTHGTN
jgi:hypothetical protein